MEIKRKELKDTVELMLSGDHNDRLRAEYEQVAIRSAKLAELIKKAEDGSLDFQLKTPLEVLKRQHMLMADYMFILYTRLAMEVGHE